MEHLNHATTTTTAQTHSTAAAAAAINQYQQQTFRQQQQQHQQQQQQQNEHQQQFCLRWHNHQTSLLSTLPLLLDQSQLTDVSISAEGRILRAHRVVLSACSTFFLELFRGLETTNHPVIVIPGASFAAIVALLNFMYSGEVNVYEEQIPVLLNLAETLGIKGLADVQNNNKSTRRGRDTCAAVGESLPSGTPTSTPTPTTPPSPPPLLPPPAPPQAASASPSLPTAAATAATASALTMASPSAAAAAAAAASLLLPPPLTSTANANITAGCQTQPSLPLLGGLMGAPPPISNHPLANHLLSGGGKLPLPLESLLFKSLQFYPNLLPQPLNFSQNALNKTSELLAKYQQQQQQQQQQHCGNYYESVLPKFNYHADEFALPENETAGIYCGSGSGGGGGGGGGSGGGGSAAKRLCAHDRQQQQQQQQQKDIKRIDRIVETLRCSGGGSTKTHEAQQQPPQPPYALRLHNACNYGAMAAAVAAAHSPQQHSSSSSSSTSGNGSCKQHASSSSSAAAAAAAATSMYGNSPSSSSSSSSASSAVAAAAAQQQLAAACAFAAAAAASMSPTHMKPPAAMPAATTAASAASLTQEPPPSYAASCAAAVVAAAAAADYSSAVDAALKAEGGGGINGGAGVAAQPYKPHLSTSPLSATPLTVAATPNSNAATCGTPTAPSSGGTQQTQPQPQPQSQQQQQAPPIKSVSNSKLYATCFICHKQLSNQYNLRVHLETHQNVRYACTVCPHVSRSKDALRKHVSYRHPGAPSPCETEARRKRAATTTAAGNSSAMKAAAVAAVTAASSSSSSAAALDGAAATPLSPVVGTTPSTPTQHLTNAFMFLPNQFQLANAAAAAAVVRQHQQQQQQQQQQQLQQENLQNMASMLSGCVMAAAAATPTSTPTATAPATATTTGAVTATTTATAINNTTTSDLLSNIKIESSPIPTPTQSPKCLESDIMADGTAEVSEEKVAIMKLRSASPSI